MFSSILCSSSSATSPAVSLPPSPASSVPSVASPSASSLVPSLSSPPSASSLLLSSIEEVKRQVRQGEERSSRSRKSLTNLSRDR